MDMTTRKFINCEEEAIHLCGMVQHTGALLVFDGTDRCVACSDNVGDFGIDAAPGVLLSELQGSLALPEDPELIKSRLTYPDSTAQNRLVYPVQLPSGPCSLSIYYRRALLFVEFERQIAGDFNINELYQYTNAIDASADDGFWTSLCLQIAKIIKYDRVMVYQFREDRSGQVIAEYVEEGLEPLLGYRYPEFDIPAQARELYKINVARVTSDVHAPRIPIRGLESRDIDLTLTDIRAMSSVHLEYLKNAGMQASCSFSILVDGNLWGMVACQNRTPKAVDIFQRHVGTILTQYAVNRYVALEKEKELRDQQEIEEILFNLKDKIVVKSNILESLEECSDAIMEFAAADGMAVLFQDELVKYGSTPADDQILRMRDEIEQNGEPQFFVTDAFYSKGKEGGDSFLPGVAYVNVASHSELQLLLFRKEVIQEETWAGAPEKVIKTDRDTLTSYASPRTSFEAWKNEIRGKSEKWGRKERRFLERLSQLIQESIVMKTTEIHKLNARLKELNHLHDTFSYTLTHDLKNMLSSIRLASQFMTQNEQNHQLVKKLSENILDTVHLMSDMLDKTLAFSKAKTIAVSKEDVALEKIVPKIVDDNIKRYAPGGEGRFDVVLGTLLPVKSDKTLLYQIFLNVIGNAVKYSSKGAAPRVAIRSYVEEPFIVYSIADNGIGMREEDIKQAFEIFKRLPNSSGFEGSGVGLAIVKRIMDKIGGRIELESAVGKGTTFYLKFPR